MRLVLDTDVVVAAMRSPAGASAAILRSLRQGQATLLLSVPLALEYESVCQKAEHRLAAGLSERQVDTFVNAVIAMAEPVETHFLAGALITFNVRDYGSVPSRFGVDLLLPREAIWRIRR
ncbi:MAG: PIN domain-containing protein [Bryobacteraceae bacterium]